MCTANRPKPCQANLLSDRLPEIKTLDSAGPVTGGSAYEAGKRKAPRSHCFVKKPSRHQPRLPPPAGCYIAGCPTFLSIAVLVWLLLLVLDSSQQKMSQYSGKVSNDPTASLSAWDRRA